MYRDLFYFYSGPGLITVHAAVLLWTMYLVTQCMGINMLQPAFWQIKANFIKTIISTRQVQPRVLRLLQGFPSRFSISRRSLPSEGFPCDLVGTISEGSASTATLHKILTQPGPGLNTNLKGLHVLLAPN